MAQNFAKNSDLTFSDFFEATNKSLKEAEQNYKRNPNVENLNFENCRLFMGGIPISKTKDEVWQQLLKKGIRNLTDVIMYRSYSDKCNNRGFVFLEFKNHQSAVDFRSKYVNNLQLWGKPMVIDWSIPIQNVDEEEMKKVSKS